MEISCLHPATYLLFYKNSCSLVYCSCAVRMVLLPPGIRNEGNICYASSILHLLMNQRVFVEVLDDVRLEHLPSCCDCVQGMCVPLRINYLFSQRMLHVRWHCQFPIETFEVHHWSTRWVEKRIHLQYQVQSTLISCFDLFLKG